MDGFDRREPIEESGGTDLVAAIDAGIEIMKARMRKDGADKTLLSDLVRLLQLRKELDAERPRQISVRWIDGDE